jgi:outer membrane protein assembly factor BamB
VPFSTEDGALVPTVSRRRVVHAVSASTLCALFTLGTLALSPGASARPESWDQYQGGASHLGATNAPAVPLKPAWSKPFSIAPGGPNSNYGVSAPVFTGDVAVAVGPTDVYEISVSSGTIEETFPKTFGPSVTPAISQVSGRGVILFTQGFGEGPGPKTSPSASTATPFGSASPSAAGSGGGSSSVARANVSPAPPDGSRSSTTPELVAIDASSGKPVWRSPVVLGGVSRTGVTVLGSTAYVGDNSGTVYAVDISTGKLLWTHGVNGYLETSIAADGSVVVATTQFNIGVRSGPTVAAMDPASGKALWTYQDNGAGASAPVLDGGLAFVSFGEGRLIALRTGSGAIAWDRGLRGTTSLFQIPAVSQGVLVLTDSRGRVYGFDEMDGRPLWEFATNEGLQRGSPVISGKDVLVGTNSGRVVAVDTNSGRMVFETGPSASGYRSMGASGSVLVVTRSGEHPGSIGFINDPSGRLVSVRSPTVLVPGKMLSSFLVAAILVVLISLLLGRPLLSRMGPVRFGSDGSEEDREDDVGRGES